MKRNETGSGSGGSGTISGRKDEKVVFFFPAAKKSQKNTWLSTFFHFMRGENDEMLETISRCRLSLYYYQVVYVMPGIYEPQQQQPIREKWGDTSYQVRSTWYYLRVAVYQSITMRRRMIRVGALMCGL